MGSTYWTMKMAVCISLLLLIALINGVQMEDPLSTDSSGDGESFEVNSPVSLIDDNGDIHAESTVDLGTNISVVKSEMDSAEDSLNKVSNETTVPTVIVNVTEAILELTSTTSSAVLTELTVATTTVSPETNPPTTESTKPDTTTVMPETTTVETTTSTTISSSVDEEVTTETEMETSSLSFEATVQEKMDKSTEKTPPIRSTTESTVLTPGAERSVCTFVEEEFSCRDELVCYGDGEIDCTDYDEEDPGVEADVVKQVSTYTSKSNVMGKNDEKPLADSEASAKIGNVKSAAKTEDFAEYDDGSDTIETYPPNLVGVASRKRIPFVLRPFASTEVSPNETDEISTTAMARTDEAEHASTTITVLPDNKELMGNASTTLSFFATENTEGSDVSQGLIYQATTAAETATSTPQLSESNSNLTLAETLTTAEDITPKITNDTVSNDEINGEITTEMDKQLTISSTTPLGEHLTKVRRSVFKLLRRKRQNDFVESNSSSSQAQSFHVAALESSQRKLRVKVCRLSGDIVCTPMPTVTMCKGKTYCQANSSPADTTESATTRSVETWAIIVIVVCALSGFLTICLLIYLVVTSCKKLKVQPSIEVTTLNYINRGASSNEVA